MRDHPNNQHYVVREDGSYDDKGNFWKYPETLSPPGVTAEEKLELLGIRAGFLHMEEDEPPDLELELAELYADIGPPLPGDEDYIPPPEAPYEWKAGDVYDPTRLQEDFIFPSHSKGKGSLVDSLPGSSADMFTYKLHRKPARVFFIDTGDMPYEKAQEYLDAIKAEMQAKKAPPAMSTVTEGSLWLNEANKLCVYTKGEEWVEVQGDSDKPVSKTFTAVYNPRNAQVPSPHRLPPSLLGGNGQVTL